MKRVFWGAVLVAAMLSCVAFAGPTLSLAGATYLGETHYAPGVGLQWDSALVGGLPLETNLYFAGFDWEGGPDWSVTWVSVWDFGVKLPIANGWYGEVGIAIPSGMVWESDAIVFLGVQPGLLLGGGWESINGHGGKVLVYVTEDTVGLAVIGCVDLARLFNPVAGGTGE